MLRFTISHHTGSKQGDHYDLMLEQGEVLKTWRIHKTGFQVAQAAVQVKDHRKAYLDFEGELSGERGRVKVWDTGAYSVDLWKDRSIQVALVGRIVKTRLLLSQEEGAAKDAEPRWTVSDATQEIRKAAAALLREATLEDAPGAELADLRAELAREERKIMSLVDQYTRGGVLDWPEVKLDPELRKRIDSEKVRWQHPWLAAAKSYADRLAGLTAQLRRSPPT